MGMARPWRIMPSSHCAGMIRVFHPTTRNAPRKKLNMRLLLTWLINAAALMALPYLMHSVAVSNVGTALIAALVLGLVNTLIRPVLVLLTLPVTLLSMGLFILVINALLFWLVSHWVSGFEVAGFWSAFLAAILYSIISWALSTLLLKDDGNS
jgi:putative membrane protein